jgi:hypothetical protein
VAEPQPSPTREPVLQFFPRLWRSDPEIRALDLELRAALLELHALAASFPDGRVPHDPKALTQQLGVTKRRLRRWLRQLRPFIAHQDELVIQLRVLDALRRETARR